VGLKLTDLRVKSELIFVPLIPSELDSLVSIVSKVKSDSLGFSNDAVANVNLVFLVVRQTLERDTFFVASSHKKDLVLFISVVQGAERQQELVGLSHLRSVANIKPVVTLLSNGVAHVTLELERVVSDSVKADCSWNLTFVFQYNRDNSVFSDSSFAETENRSAISILLSWFVNLQSWECTFTPDFENEFAHLRFWVTVFNNGF
jgi:hypothetical protein